MKKRGKRMRERECEMERERTSDKKGDKCKVRAKDLSTYCLAASACAHTMHFTHLAKIFTCDLWCVLSHAVFPSSTCCLARAAQTKMVNFSHILWTEKKRSQRPNTHFSRFRKLIRPRVWKSINIVPLPTSVCRAQDFTICITAKRNMFIFFHSERRSQLHTD